MPSDIKKNSAQLFGEKCAIEVAQPYKKHKPQWAMSESLRNSVISKSEAQQIAKAMASSAPHGALDNTRVDLYGTNLTDLQQRMVENPRSAPLQKYLARFDTAENLPDKTQLLPDAYHPHADTVWLPGGNPGVLMHELGHSIDFNGYPNTTPRMMLAGAYTRLAPTIWKEHAAWSKGRHHFLEGAAQNKLPPKLVVKALRDATKAKRTGLGSYWGAGLGTLAGGGLGALGTYALMQNNVHGRLAGLPLALGLTLGPAIGGIAGITLGNRYAEDKYHDSPEAAQKYLDEYAKTYARKHDVSLEDAHAALQTLAKKRLAKGKNKSRSKAASVSVYDIPEFISRVFGNRPPAHIQSLRQALIATSAGGAIGGIKGYLMPGYEEKLDDEGRVISKKKIEPLRGALQGAGIGAGTGLASNYAAQMLARYNPHIDDMLKKLMK